MIEPIPTINLKLKDRLINGEISLDQLSYGLKKVYEKSVWEEKINNDSYYLEIVPKHLNSLKTNQAHYKRVYHNIDWLPKIPITLQTKKLWKTFIYYNPCRFMSECPKKFHTHELITFLLEKDPSLLYTVPNHYMTTKNIINMIVSIQSKHSIKLEEIYMELDRITNFSTDFQHRY